MKLSFRLSLFIVCLFVFCKTNEAFFRTEALFRPSARERIYEEQFNFYLKDSKPRLSPNQRAIIVNLATAAIRKLNSYSYNAYSNSTNSPLQSVRAIGNQLGLSTKAVGEFKSLFKKKSC